MRRLILFACVASTALCVCVTTRAVDAAPKARYVVRIEKLEVEPTRPHGVPWDLRRGSQGSPDAQVTLMRQDEQALRTASELYVQEAMRRTEAAGHYVMPGYAAMIARDAPRALSDGAFMARWNDPALNEVRSRFASDTPVAQDSTKAEPQDENLNVSVGDRISVFVNDVDLANDDAIGETEIEITQAAIDAGESTLVFGSVAALRLTIEKAGE